MPTGMLTKKIHGHEKRLDEDAAEQQAHRAATDRDRGPHAHRLRPLGTLGERRGHDRERGGGDERCAEALQPAGDDEELRGRREPADERADGEDHHTGEEHSLPADEVACPAAQQQEAAEDERVCVHDPLQVGARHLEVGLDRRQRDVDDRRVEDDHELRDADEDENEPRVLGRGHAYDATDTASACAVRLAVLPTVPACASAARGGRRARLRAAASIQESRLAGGVDVGLALAPARGQRVEDDDVQCDHRQ